MTERGWIRPHGPLSASTLRISRVSRHGASPSWLRSLGGRPTPDRYVVTNPLTQRFAMGEYCLDLTKPDIYFLRHNISKHAFSSLYPCARINLQRKFHNTADGRGLWNWPELPGGSHISGRDAQPSLISLLWPFEGPVDTRASFAKAAIWSEVSREMFTSPFSKTVERVGKGGSRCRRNYGSAKAMREAAKSLPSPSGGSVEIR